MGTYMVLTEAGERKRESFGYQPEGAPEETCFAPRGFDMFVLSELGHEQPIGVEHFLLYMDVVRRGRLGQRRAVEASLGRLSQKGYIEGF